MRSNIENMLLTCNNAEDVSDDETYVVLGLFLTCDTRCGMERKEVKMVNERG